MIHFRSENAPKVYVYATFFVGSKRRYALIKASQTFFCAWTCNSVWRYRFLKLLFSLCRRWGSVFKCLFLGQHFNCRRFDRCSADCRGKVMNEYYASLNESALVQTGPCFVLTFARFTIYSLFSGQSSFILDHHLSISCESEFRQASDISSGNECVIRCDIA